MAKAKTKKPKRDYSETKSGICKISWVFLFSPRPPEDDAERDAISTNTWKRSLSLMIPKNTSVIDAKISDEGKEKIVAAGKAFKAEYERRALASALLEFSDCADREALEEDEIRWSPVLDGDSRKMLKLSAGNAGFWIIRASTYRDYSIKGASPSASDMTGKQLLAAKDLTAGCWVKAFLALGPYTVSGNSGVTAYLGNILKCYKGSASFTSATFQDDEIEDFESEADDEQDEVEGEDFE